MCAHSPVTQQRAELQLSTHQGQDLLAWQEAGNKERQEVKVRRSKQTKVVFAGSAQGVALVGDGSCTKEVHRFTSQNEKVTNHDTTAYFIHHTMEINSMLGSGFSSRRQA